MFADYSDPDVICISKDYYMVCSVFHFMGIPPLHSTELVNWRIVNRLYDRLLPGTDYNHLKKYGSADGGTTFAFLAAGGLSAGVWKSARERCLPATVYAV